MFEEIVRGNVRQSWSLRWNWRHPFSVDLLEWRRRLNVYDGYTGRISRMLIPIFCLRFIHAWIRCRVRRVAEPDFLDEIIAERTEANPDFPWLLKAAAQRRYRRHVRFPVGLRRRLP